VKRKLVLFDIDGTLLLSAGAGRRAIHAAVTDYLASAHHGTGAGRAPQTIRFDGKTDPQIVIELLAAAGYDTAEAGRVQAVLDHYVAHLERDLAANGHRAYLMPGVPALLDALEADDGTVLGLLTGNVRRGAQLKLRAVGIDPARFRVGAFGCDHPDRPRLPPIAAERAEPIFGRRPDGCDVVIVGDTPADVWCAGSIGARTVAVATGSYRMDELHAAGADRVFADFTDTARALEAMLS